MNLNIKKENYLKNIDRLTNQMWKLIPMRENDEDWGKQLTTVIIEIAGLSELFKNEPLFLQLLAKMQGLRKVETEFNIYRKTVFECISLLRECDYGQEVVVA